MFSGGSKCCLSNCTSITFGKKEIQTKFHRFPKDNVRCAVWIEQCKPINLPSIDPDILCRNHRLCSLHFEDKMYTNLKKTRLSNQAIPTLFKSNIFVIEDQTSQHVEIPSECFDENMLTENVIIDSPLRCSTPVSFTHNSSTCSSSTSIDTCSISIQTPNSLTGKTSRKHVLQGQLSDTMASIKELEQQLKHTTTIEYCMKMCEQYLSPSVNLLVKNNIINKEKSKSGQRYAKQFALTIYFLGPDVFHFLQKSFSLPSIRTLRRSASQYDLKPGLNDCLFNFLEFKMSNFHADALDCFLRADEILLKPNLYYNITKDEIIGFNQSNSFRTYEPAKYALVLMIRGIKYNWKQPIAYYLFSNNCSSPDLNFIIFSTIRRLRNINLNVRCLVTDQGSNFIRFSNANHVSPKEPFFEVDGRQVIYIFDPSHLLKSTRNMFFKNVFKINEDLVDKKHLDHFYNYFNKRDLPLAHKLTYLHIHPGPLDKTKVHLAAQVFSATVAAGMSTALNFGLIPVESRRTIYFINDMDKLFDIFDSREIHNGKIFNSPFNNASPQLDHLIKMTEIFTNLKVIDKMNNTDVTKRTHFINGWLVSISGLKMLWKSLNPTQNKTYNISTGRFNENYLENLFGNIRQQHNSNPTPIQLIQSFKKIFWLQYFKHIPGANCLKDLDQVLTYIEKQPTTNKMTKLFAAEEQNHLFNFKSIKIGTVDYRKLNIPEKNSYALVSGYIMKKCMEKHVCQVCVDYANHQKTLDQSFLLAFFEIYSANDSINFSKQLMPNDEFYNYIIQLEDAFIDYFPSIATYDNIGSTLKDLLCNIRFNHPCVLFNKQFLIDLFIRFRIFTAITFLNRSMLSEKKRKNRKLSCLKHL